MLYSEYKILYKCIIHIKYFSWKKVSGRLEFRVNFVVTIVREKRISSGLYFQQSYPIFTAHHNLYRRIFFFFIATIIGKIKMLQKLLIIFSSMCFIHFLILLSFLCLNKIIFYNSTFFTKHNLLPM